MKKLFFFIFCFTISSFTQNSKNIIELESELKSVQQTNNVEVNKVIQESSGRKKPILGILYSLLLPGMGELYAESYSSGKYFTIAEGTLWGVFAGMNIYANWQVDRYKSFAVSKAGIATEGKDEDYYSIISQYLSIDEYNNAKALDREFEKLYPQKYYWKWKSQEERKEYRSLWLSSEQTFNDVRFVVGAMLVNRLASVINAIRLVSAYNKKISEEVSWNFSAGISNEINLPHSLTLNFQKSF